MFQKITAQTEVTVLSGLSPWFGVLTAALKERQYLISEIYVMFMKLWKDGLRQNQG